MVSGIIPLLSVRYSLRIKFYVCVYGGNAVIDNHYTKGCRFPSLLSTIRQELDGRRFVGDIYNSILMKKYVILTHWGRVMHICVSKLTIIGSDNGLSLGRRQAIIWTNAGILLIGTLGTNFSETLSEIHTYSFKKMHLKTSPAKRRPFWLGLNVLTDISRMHGWYWTNCSHSSLNLSKL